ncbi:MAG TPA: glycosyltransferase [Thermoleophilaceae bacterium]
MQHVVWIPGNEREWALPPALATDHGWLGGGRRTMHELAVALACGGHAVEMRGEVDADVLGELSTAAGATPELPGRSRELTADDVVFVYEGVEDPLVYAHLALSPARVVLMVLAPPGLCGWPFAAGWSVPDHLSVDPVSVARPEHFEAAAALGFELWTNAPGLQRASSVPCRYVGRGLPMPFPDPPAEKDIDVVVLENNRWAPLAARVAEELGTRAVVAPLSGNRELIDLFGRARVFVHPMRVEGNSRLSTEARAMGAVPVVLATNPYGVNTATVAAPSVEQMAGTVERLLADPARLRELSAEGIAFAREEVAWEPYVERVTRTLAAGGTDVARPARAAMGAALRAAEQQRLAAVERELDHHRGWLETTNGSLSWRLTAPLRAAKRRVRQRVSGRPGDRPLRQTPP